MVPDDSPFGPSPVLLPLVLCAALTLSLAACERAERDTYRADTIPEELQVPQWQGPSSSTLALWQSSAAGDIPAEAEGLLHHYRDSRRALGLYAHVPLPDEATEQAGDVVARYQEALAQWIRSEGIESFQALGHALWPAFEDTLQRAAQAAVRAENFDEWIAANAGDPIREAYLGVAGDYMRAAQSLGLRDEKGQLLGDPRTERLLFARWWSQQIPGQYPVHLIADPDEQADFHRFLALTQKDVDASTRYTWWQEAHASRPLPDGPAPEIIHAALLFEEHRPRAAQRVLADHVNRNEADARTRAALRWLDAHLEARAAERAAAGAAP